MSFYGKVSFIKLDCGVDDFSIFLTITAEEDTMAETALEGLKVLDLTRYIAGPQCTKLLADYGAEVIKIEKPGEGDPARRLGPFPNDEPDPEKSGLFLHLNTNKKSITLNLKSEGGKRIFKSLVADVDILVENFSPRVMPELGLGYLELEQLNPRLVMVSISNFGQTGPYRDYKAAEITSWAMGSRMYSTGHPDRPPLKLAGSVVQYLAGTNAAAAAMSALFGSLATGEGQQVDISIQECLLGAVDNNLLSHQYDHEVNRRQGGRREGTYPMGYYFANDGFFQLQGPSVRHWPRIVRALGIEELEDPKFSDPATRTQHHGDFDAIFYPWAIVRTKGEIVQMAQDAKAYSAPLLNMEEVVNNEHHNSRGFFVEVEHPIAGKFKYPGAPIKFPQTPWGVRSPAPTLGQDNIEIYCGRLGYSKSQIVTLRQQNVI